MFTRRTICEQIAAYSAAASWDVLAPETRTKIKDHVLDALRCALGALGAAAFYNEARIRYLSWTRSYLRERLAICPITSLALAAGVARLLCLSKNVLPMPSRR